MMMQTRIFPALASLVDRLDEKTVPEPRQALLLQVANFIKSQLAGRKPVNLVFICTHNSRRSVLAQFWAQVMAAYYAIPGVDVYSAGTEATEVYPKIPEILQASGAKVEKSEAGKNPVHFLYIGNTLSPIKAFSKTWQHKENPTSEFAAIMVCSDAEKNCPFIPGSAIRIGLPYEDPKSSDGTPQQEEVYWQRNLEIAAEMKFIFSNL